LAIALLCDEPDERRPSDVADKPKTLCGGLFADGHRRAPIVEQAKVADERLEGRPRGSDRGMMFGGVRIDSQTLAADRVARS
jgi:hypothetical protein